jgi:hypothetical protein
MRFSTMMAVAALVFSAPMATAQQPTNPHPPGHGQARPMGRMEMADHMRAMDSLNARLDTLVSRMNRATGNRKVAAMADVITELVAQRQAMHAQMRQMMQAHSGMQGHPGMNAHPGMMRPRMRDSTPDTSSAGARPPS